MKKTSTITKLVTLSLLTATMLHATNGDNLIGVGAKSRAMGGTGIALGHGAESAFTNPATITEMDGTEISFGGTLFMPKIETQIVAPTMGNMVLGQEKSSADRNIIPSVSIASKINENWFIGAGMWGTAGMGVDYRENARIPAGFPGAGSGTLSSMVTNLQLLSFGVPIAYRTSGFSIGVTPILQYGNLDMQFDDASGTRPGAGLSQDFGFGWQAGITYDFGEVGMDGLSIGATYKSSIEMDYNGQIASAAAAFGLVGFTDTLEQPEEYGAGIAYVMGAHTFAFDYKKIKWSSAKGYSDFAWEDSDVYAFGYEFQATGWAVRLGYNYGASAVVEQDAMTQKGATLNTLNLLGFPATAQHHYTFGGTYELSEMFSADLAYVYSPTSTKSFGTGNPGMPGVPLVISNTHAEDSLSFQFNFKF